MTDGSTRLPDGTRLGRAALRVEDLRGVGEFYVDVVGLEVIKRTDEWATLGAGGEALLELKKDEEATTRGQDEAGLFHTALRVPTREALGDALNRIETLWDVQGASDHDVSEALYLSDPEGNGIEIYRDRDRDQWPVDADGRVEMGTKPLDLDAIRTGNGWKDDVPTDTRLGHVHLETTSLPTAREFYVDTLGLRVTQEFDEMGLFLAADDYHHHLGLNTWNERTEPAQGRGIDWVEFVVPDETALDALHERMAAAGFDVEAVDEGVEIRDPDEIGVRVRPARETE